MTTDLKAELERLGFECGAPGDIMFSKKGNVYIFYVVYPGYFNEKDEWFICRNLDEDNLDLGINSFITVRTDEELLKTLQDLRARGEI